MMVPRCPGVPWPRPTVLLAGPRLWVYAREDPVAQVPADWPQHHVAVVCPLEYVVVPALVCHLLPAVSRRVQPHVCHWACGVGLMCRVQESQAEGLIVASRVPHPWTECGAIAVVQHP